MIPLDLNKIKHYLSTKGIEGEIQQESNQLCVLFKFGEREYPLFIRIYEGDALLQLLTFLPCNTKENTLGDTARLLHLLNKEVDTPGFGMDESAMLVFYRSMVPVNERKIDEKLFDAYLSASQVLCQSFAPVIAAVAYGAVTFEDVLKKTKEQGGQTFSNTQLKTD